MNGMQLQSIGENSWRRRSILLRCHIRRELISGNSQTTRGLNFLRKVCNEGFFTITLMTLDNEEGEQQETLLEDSGAVNGLGSRTELQA